MTITIVITTIVVAAIVGTAAVITIYIIQRNLKSIQTTKNIFQKQVAEVRKATLSNALSDLIHKRRIDIWNPVAELYRTALTSDDILWALQNITHSTKTRSIEAPAKTEKIIEEKEQRFLSVPSISFHFANEEDIKDFYNEYFKEPTIENLVSEITGEVNSEIKGSLPQIIESRISGNNLSKWISAIKLPDASLNGMFLRFQRETIKNKQVALGIEEVDIELTDVNNFDEAIEKLKNNFGFIIDETSLNSQRVKLREKAAEKTLSKLEKATGWVLIEGKFKIEDKIDFYRLTYTHPVNQYLSNQANSVTISISIPKTSLKEHIKGNYAQSIGKSIPLKIYGQVWQPIDRKADIWDLQLTPLAIY